MKKHSIAFLTLVVLFFLTTTSCNKEYLDPSSTSETQSTSDVNGLIALVNGLQYRFTVSRAAPTYSTVTASGLTTKEFTVLNAGNTDEENLRIGAGNVASGNSLVTNIWEQCHLVKASANIILNSTKIVGDAGTKTGIAGYASIFKALALGTLAQFFQQAPIAVAENAAFSSREDLLKEAIAVLEEAATTAAAAPVSAAFTARTGGGIDIPNTIQALIARYATILGDHAKALAAAEKVDITKQSVFRFDDLTRNPMWDVAINNINVVQPLNLNMGLPEALKPAVADKRTDFYFVSRTATNNVFRGKGFFTGNSAVVPIYLPGEILLIKAEAQARLGAIDKAIAELDKVLTKKTDAFALGADLPAYSGDKTKEAVLLEIYRNRAIELFMSGMKLEDSRRFGRPGPKDAGAERSRNWYPYPNSERDNNTNTPANPDI
jgi:starch-binding outer membrane protein, SusD/RagB family